MKIIAFIAVRKKSARIPNKNIKPMCGKPLVFWTIDAADKCMWTDEVWIATDSDEIQDKITSQYCWDKVKIYRTRHMDDTCIQETVMLDFIADGNDFDSIVLIQATSPLLTSADLNDAIAIHIADNYDSLVSVVSKTYLTWGEDVLLNAYPINFSLVRDQWPRRVNVDKTVIGNGAFWITTKDQLLKTKKRVSGNIGLFPMPEETLYEVDTFTDWIIIENLLQRRLNEVGSNNRMC